MFRKNFSSGIRLLFVTLLLAVFSLGGAFPIAASSFNTLQGLLPQITEYQKLTAPGTTNGHFGFATAMDGNTAIISALEGDLGDGQSEGTAYIFVRNGTSWVKQAKLTASDGEIDNYFGASVAVDGDTALVGATGINTGNSAAYVFVRSGTTWTEQAKLSINNVPAQDDFGWAVAVQGNTAVVSFLSTDNEEGAAYVFVRSGTTWTQQAKLTASDGAPDDGFGWSLAISGETLLVGAPTKSAAYVFVRSGTTWTQQAKIASPDPNSNFYQFGKSVGLENDTALIGAPLGYAAYVFVRSGTTWTSQAKLTSSENTSQEFLGWSVALDGDNALVSAIAPSDVSSPGASYLFARSGTTWTAQVKFMTHNGKSRDFGISSALDDGIALVGAAGDQNSGAAFAFFTDPNATPELLVNGGFEVDSNGDFVPDGWTRKNPTGDGRRCNQAGQPAYEGACSYLFKDDASGNNKLLQNVDLNVHDLNAGDQVKLTGFYNKQSAGSIEIRLFVTYASLPEDEAHITLTQTTSGYKAINPLAITLDAKPTRVRVQIQNQTTSGKTWFDGLSLKLTDNSSIAPLIPLPLPLP